MFNSLKERVNAWSNKEVAHRRLRLYPKECDDQGLPKDPEDYLIEAILGNPGPVGIYYNHPNPISRFMNHKILEHA